MQAYLASSIIICKHAYASQVITLQHCHIVVVGMTLLQLLSVGNIADIKSAFMKHWRQSAFAETPLMACRSREARRRRASLLVYIYIKCHFDKGSRFHLPLYISCIVTPRMHIGSKSSETLHNYTSFPFPCLCSFRVGTETHYLLLGKHITV